MSCCFVFFFCPWPSVCVCVIAWIFPIGIDYPSSACLIPWGAFIVNTAGELARKGKARQEIEKIYNKMSTIWTISVVYPRLSKGRIHLECISQLCCFPILSAVSVTLVHTHCILHLIRPMRLKILSLTESHLLPVPKLVMYKDTLHYYPHSLTT